MLTPLAIRVARRLGFFDVPVGYKAHGRPTPYLGGAALLCALCGGALVFAAELHRSGPLLAGAFTLWLLGTIDDRRNLGPGIRVLVEAGVALGIWAAGLGWTLFDLEAANGALTVLWIVGVVNAFNLMDNMDGAASTVAAVCATAIGVVATVSHDIPTATMALAAAGACVAFLRFNLASPARIFLGDGGSMPIGLVVATCAIAVADGENGGATALAAAVLFVGLPVLDTSLVVLSRRRRHVPVLVGGRDHITHRLGLRLGSARAVAARLALVQGMLCCAAAVAVGGNHVGQTAIAALVAAVALGLLAASLLGRPWNLREVRSQATAR